MGKLDLLVSEIFGPTIQGEGPYTGRPCAFVRLAVCPLECVFCDTPYTWAWTEALAKRHVSGKQYDMEREVKAMTVEDVLLRAIVATNGAGIVVISGGEPLAQVPPRYSISKDPTPTRRYDDPLGMLVLELQQRAFSPHVETAGVRMPSALVDEFVTQYVVSPKLQSSGNVMKKRNVPEVLQFFASSPKAVFKFVVTSEDDLAEIDQITRAYHIGPERVWLMPEGTKPKSILDGQKVVAKAALERGYNVSTRLHVLIWGDRRGH